MLLLTSASTAVKLDHYDANLRRCCNPGEEPGSVRLIDREEETKAGEEEEERRNDECMRIGGEGERQTEDPCLGVIASTVMMKQPSRLRDTMKRAQFGSAPYSQKSIS